MSIRYVKFSVGVHGLNLSAPAELDALRLRIKEIVEEHHPAGCSNILDSDVEVDVDECAGTFD